MPSAKTDRRVERSRQALQRALVELIVERGYDALTVKDIADRANVGRSTFYAHFADKEDLFRDNLAQLRGQLVPIDPGPAPRDVPPALAFSLPLLRHVADARDLVEALMRSGPGVRDLLHELFTDLALDGLQRQPTSTSAPAEVVAQFLAGSFLAVLQWWVRDGRDMTPEDADGLYTRLASTGLVGWSGGVEDHGATMSEPWSPERARDFASLWLPAWTGNDPELLASFYTQDVFYLDPVLPDGIQGQQALLAYFRRLLAKNPAWVWTQRQAIPMEGGFVNLWHAVIPVGDTKIHCDGVCLVFMRGDRIHRNEVYFDRTTLVP